MDGRIPALAVALVVSLLGCAGNAWRHARSEDSISAYYTFLRDHPTSRFSDEAHARLELARLRKRPTRAGIEAFRARYATPDLLAELTPFVENMVFRHARALGTPASYREFLHQYPHSSFSERAAGNLAYLESDGFGGDTGELAKFAEQHPTSDYAAEAKRSVKDLRLRDATAFGRVGVVVDLNPSTPGADRLRRVFQERAAAAYAAAGMETVPLADAAASSLDSKVGAILTIRHEERESSAELQKGKVSEPAVVARTEVDLERVGAAGTIWSDVFEYRVPLSARRDSVSILFSPGSSYWSDPDREFFVPVASWSTEESARRSHAFSKPAKAVDIAGTRAIVLFGDGDLQIVDLSDPEDLAVLTEYRRERDLAKFDGVRADGSRVATFGPDGIELVVLDGEQAHREQAWGRDLVGSVVDAEAIGGQWLVATNHGLLQLDFGSKSIRTLVSRPISGMARGPADRVVFTDGVSLFVATLSSLQAGRIEGELRLGRGFAPQRVRARDHSAVVIGAHDAVWVDLQSPAPRVISRINGKDAGKILDASTIGDHLFLLGPRGLQVADPRGERIVDSVDVDARRRVEAAGRHLVMVGEKSLQVVDATAFVAPVTSAPASRD
jgi:hypothetical protein